MSQSDRYGGLLASGPQEERIQSRSVVQLHFLSVGYGCRRNVAQLAGCLFPRLGQLFGEKLVRGNLTDVTPHGLSLQPMLLFIIFF